MSLGAILWCIAAPLWTYALVLIVGGRGDRPDVKLAALLPVGLVMSTTYLIEPETFNKSVKQIIEEHHRDYRFTRVVAIPYGGTTRHVLIPGIRLLRDGSGFDPRTRQRQSPPSRPPQDVPRDVPEDTVHADP